MIPVKAGTITHNLDRFVRAHPNQSFYIKEIREWLLENHGLAISGRRLQVYLQKHKLIERMEITHGNIKYYVKDGLEEFIDEVLNL